MTRIHGRQNRLKSVVAVEIMRLLYFSAGATATRTFCQIGWCWTRTCWADSLWIHCLIRIHLVWLILFEICWINQGSGLSGFWAESDFFAQVQRRWIAARFVGSLDISTRTLLDCWRPDTNGDESPPWRYVLYHWTYACSAFRFWSRCLAFVPSRRINLGNLFGINLDLSGNPTRSHARSVIDLASFLLNCLIGWNTNCRVGYRNQSDIINDFEKIGCDCVTKTMTYNAIRG